jgi:quercetin dioxygenase-like cupin family protein
MTNRRTWHLSTIAVLCGWAVTGRAVADGPVTGKPARSRTAFSHALSPLDGRRLQASLVEVTYEPGGSSAAHSHPCPVVVHVIEGAIRTQVKGEPEATYKAGESFYEAANGVHQVSANASTTAPAKFIAVFVCDHDTPLSVPSVPASAGGRR